MNPLSSKTSGENRNPVISGDRQRSQRVLLRVPATVHFNASGKETSLPVMTLSVNSFGAMLVAPKAIPMSSQMVIEHGKTGERVACRVMRTPRQMPEGFHIPVEFDPPAPGFWQIEFPPTDWRPPEDL